MSTKHRQRRISQVILDCKPKDAEYYIDSHDIVDTVLNTEPVRLDIIQNSVSGSIGFQDKSAISSSENSISLSSQILPDTGDDSVPREIKTLLHSLPFFSGLTESDEFIDNISKTLRIRKCKPGDVIVSQGEVAKAMFFIIKGTLKVISEDGEIDFAELSSGTYCGFIHLTG
jgi:Cyclic nucleotide-binding domain